MVSKRIASIELPPGTARAFVADMRKYFAEKDAFKADAIAVRQLRALESYRRPHERKLRIHDVKEMFAMMREHLEA